jgi:hypothetical protein
MSLLNHPIVAPLPTIVIMIDIESPIDSETVVPEREEKMRMEGEGRIEGQDAEIEDDEFVAVVRERLVKAQNWAFQ